jgi:hypothetical protein
MFVVGAADPGVRTLMTEPSSREVDLEKLALELRRLGYSKPDAQKISDTFKLMINAPENQRLIILRRLNYFMK